MKKIILTTILSLFYVTSASAEIGVNIGVAGQMGLFAATAKETNTSNTSKSNEDTEIAGVGFASVFIEKTLGEHLSIGVDYVPSALESDTVETAKQDLEGTSNGANKQARTNKVQIDFEDLTTYYVSLNLGDAYIKAGIMDVDVITNENMGTGASYGNTSLDGTLIGVGYNKTFDNTMFVRIETNYMEFDGTSLTSNDDKITLKNLDGVSGKVSIGKSF